MTVFVLQEKKVGSPEMDDITICENFDILKSKFDGQLMWHRHDGFEEVSVKPLEFVEESDSDEDCFTGGEYEFVDKEGNHIVGKAMSYWLDI